MSKKLPTLLIVSPDFPPSKGGVEKFVGSIADYYSCHGYNVRVLCGTRVACSVNNIIEEQYNNIHITRIPTMNPGGMDLPKRLKYYYAIWQELKRADIVHLNDVRVFFTSVWLAKLRYKFKVILTSHGFIFHTKRNGFIKNIYSKYFSFIVKKFFEKVIVNGFVDLSFCKKNHIDCELINHGIPLKQYHNIVRHVKNGEFLYFGRIDKNKNLVSLIKGLSLFSQYDRNFRCKICGTGEPGEVQRLKNEIERLDLTQFVELIGRVNDDLLLALLSTAEFVFIPSVFESFGYTLIESLAAGCTVVAQHNEQFDAMINNRNIGVYLIDFDNDQEFVKAIQSARSHYQTTNQRGIDFTAQYDEIVFFQNYTYQFNSLFTDNVYEQGPSS